MKKILRMITGVQIVIVLLMSIACKEVVDTHSPRVTPEILSIGPDTVAIKWNNVGNEYYYSVLISEDSIQDNSFLNAASVCDSTTDTVYVIRDLDSNTFYKVLVRTFGGNLAPNESWPPLKFRTE